jgi:hypothetical protein
MNVKIPEIEKMIFVGTCPRSGSSMLTGILDRAGAFGGVTNGITKGNTKGQHENIGIPSLVFNPAYKKLKSRRPERVWLDALDSRLPHLTNPRMDIAYVLMRHGYKSGPAYFKGGLYMFFFEQLLKAFPNSTWVLPYRDPTKIIESLTARDLGNGEKATLNAYVQAYHSMYDFIEQSGADVWRIDTNDIIANANYDKVHTLVDHLGLSWDLETVKDWIDPDLWHETRGISLTNTPKNDEVPK